jgi:hypothetical protein
MSPETRLFLLISPPVALFGPIVATCAVIGNTDQVHGVEAMFSSTKELEHKLEIAGLPECEIARAIERLHRNYPTFREISIEIAENLRLIKRSSNVASSVGERNDGRSTRHFTHRSGMGFMRGLSLV